MESFIRDVTFAFRSLKRQPAFTITAVLTIALGIGATSAIFSVVNGVALRPLPYADPEGLVAIDDPAIADSPVAPLDTPPAPAGKVTGVGPVFLLRDTGQEGVLAARYRLADLRVEIASEPFVVGGIDYPRGSWILPAQPTLRPALERVATEWGLHLTLRAVSRNYITSRWVSRLACRTSASRSLRHRPT